MIQTSSIVIREAGPQDRSAIVALLDAEKLPTADLPPSLEHFFVATEGETIVGAVGLEPYGTSGLLRSMVVNKSHRNQRIASLLLTDLEAYARSLGNQTMYLLTETAAQYFERKGYQKITRDRVPDELRSSSEFSHVCPVSATVMTKPLQHA